MQISSIEFSDGSIWTVDDIAKAVESNDSEDPDGGDDPGGDNEPGDIQYDEVWMGNSQSDEYQFNFDGKFVQIEDTDASGDSSDVLSFGDIDFEDLWFDLVDDDLRISHASRENAGYITIKKWDLGSDHQVELFEAGDYRITNQDIDVLLQAMSHFDAPMGDASHMSPEDQSNVRDIILSTWTQRE